MSKEPSALDKANDLLAPLVPRLLAAFAAYRGSKKAPQSLRTLQPLALVFLLEAFGLAFLLTEDQRAAAWAAVRGPGRKGQDDYDPTDDTEEAKALRWVAARARALDDAYRERARMAYNESGLGFRFTFAEYLKSNHAPNRADFEKAWGERNPIDPATCPAAFDPRAQLSILDAVSPERDGVLGLFVAESRLRAEAPPVLTYAGHELDLTGCSSLSDAAWRAISERWIVYLDHRGATVGLRLLPPTEGVRVRLRAPLINVIMPDVEPMREAPQGPPGVFVSLVRLNTGTVHVEVGDIRLSLYGCRLATSAASRAVCAGWSVRPCVRDGLPGLLFVPAEQIGLDAPSPLEILADVSARAAGAAAEFFDHVAAGPTEAGDYGPEDPAAESNPRAPVCPRCLDVPGGQPQGDPSNPHPGPFTAELCQACDADVGAKVAGVPRELLMGTPVHEPNTTPAQLTADQASFRSASRETLDRAAEAAGEPREHKVKPGKTKASGAESKIRKDEKRAAK